MPYTSLKDEAIDLFESPQSPLATKELIEREQNKLLIYKKVMEQLDSIKPNKFVKKEKSIRFYWLKSAFYYFLVFFGLLEDGIGSYIFAQSLLTLIPGIHTPFIIAGSALVAVVSCILFYSFEAALFKEALGITANRKERETLIQTYLEEVNLLNQINEKFFCLELISSPPENSAELADIIVLLNQNIEDKKTTLGKYQESRLQKGVRWFVTGFGAFITIAGSYYMGSSLIALIAAPLLGTPVGWILISLMIVAGLGFYFSMQGKGMHELINPEFKDFKQLKALLKTCPVRDEKEFECYHELQKELKQVRISEENEAEPNPQHHGQLHFFDRNEEDNKVKNDFTEQPSIYISL